MNVLKAGVVWRRCNGLGYRAGSQSGWRLRSLEGCRAVLPLTADLPTSKKMYDSRVKKGVFNPGAGR